MFARTKFVLGLAVLAGVACFTGGCGLGRVEVYEHNGTFGYYNYAGTWCAYGNNYCGTGNNYGIGDDGHYYNGTYYYGIGGSGGSTPVGTSGSSGFSAGHSTRDVELQRSMLQHQDLDNRAGALASRYQMNFESARQLTQLADKMQRLTAQGQMTDDDRSALAQSALGVVGLSNADVAAAMSRASQGDKTAYQGLMDRAASNLGMPSSAALRDQILPSLGISAR